MKDEIKEIIEYLKCEEEYYDGIEEVVLSSDEKVIERDDIELLLDYITNLQTIEQQYSSLLSENAELENKITNLQEENKRLKELCDKYEEEHNTAFKLWKGKLKETMDETLIQKQHDRIKELEQINEEHRKINGELRKENKRLSKDIKKTQYMLVEAYALCDEYIEKYNLLQGSDE